LELLSTLKNKKQKTKNKKQKTCNRLRELLKNKKQKTKNKKQNCLLFSTVARLIHGSSGGSTSSEFHESHHAYQ